MTLTKQDLSAIGQLFEEKFDKKFDEKFEPAFNKAFQPAFDKAFQPAFDKAFKPAFDGAFSPAFDKKFAPIKKKINKMAKDLDTVIRSTDRRITMHNRRLRTIESHLNISTPVDSY